MAINRGTDGMREVLALVGVRALRSADDSGLLRQFVEGNDEGAFRVIAERHGPMVLGVCRRVLSCPYDAEDALQATFLVFARKAGSIRSGTSLAGWLHGVATRVATTLRRERRRRRSREQAAAPPTTDEPRDELSWAEVKCGVDEELARLPAVHREVLVLCYLEGHTRDEAAQQLGVAVGVIKGRLERARKALADRLAKRGLTLSAGLLAVALSSQVAAVSVQVSALVSGSPALSPNALTLANSVLKGVTMSQLRLSATGLLAVVALATGTAFGLAQPVQAKRDDPEGKPPTRELIKAPVPKGPPPEGVFLAAKLNLSNKAELIEVIGTDGKSGGHLGLGELHNVQQVRVSPDGKRLAFIRFVPMNGPRGKPQYAYAVNEVYVVDLPVTAPPKGPVMKGLLEPSVTWAADGQSLFVSRIPAGTDVDQDSVKGKFIPKETVRYDLTTKKEAAVKLPDGHVVLDASADGKTLLTGTLVWHPQVVGRSSYLVPLDTLKPALIGDEDDGFDRARLSPDGTRVVGTKTEFSRSKDLGLFVADVKTGKAEKVSVRKEIADGLFNGRVAWAPDGKRLAVLWVGAGGGQKGVGGGAPGGGGRVKRLTVMDATGENVINVFDFSDDSVLDIDWADPKLTEKKDDPKAKPPAKDSRLLFSFSGKHDGKQFSDSVVSADPTTGTWTVLVENGYRGRVSPDGGTVVMVKDSNVYNAATDGSNNPGKLFEDDGYGGPVFSRDGKHLYVSRLIGKNGRWVHTTSRYTAAGDEPKVIPLPEGEAVFDVSPDGKTFLTRSRILPAVNTSTLYAMEADGVNKVQLSPDGGFNEPARFSPDGKRVAFVRNSKGGYEVWVIGADGKNGASVFGGKGTYIEAVCWSPGGERLAVIAADLGEGGLIPSGKSDGNWRVELISADGKEKATLPLKADEVRSLRGLDWYTPPAKAEEPKAKQPADAGLVWTYNSTSGELIGYTPDGKKAKEITIEEGQLVLALTPDGKRMLYAANEGKVDGLTLHLRALGDKGEPVDLGIPFDRARDTHPFHFTADGKKVVRTRARIANGNGRWEHIVIDLITRKEQELKGPDDAHVVGVAPDGSWALILEQPIFGGLIRPGAPAKPAPSKLHKVPLNGDEPTVLAERSTFRYAAISPNGKTVLADGTAEAVENKVQRFVGEAVLRIDVATGKITEVVANDLQSDTEVGWSPDGSLIAYLWLDLVAIPKQPGSFRPNLSRLVVCDPDGKNEETWEVHNYANGTKGYTRLLGWFPTPPPVKKDEPKAKPPAKEPIKAPVPKEKEETMGLKASVAPEKKEVMLGEPTYFAFTVENPTDKGWRFDVGGDYRNRLGRPNSFKVEVTGPDGEAVSQPDSGPDMGGISTGVKLPADGKHTFTLFLPHWATFDKPGEYTISVRRKLTLVPLGLTDDERRTVKPEVASVAASARIVVTKADAKKFGDLIDTLGVDLLNPERSGRATKMLLEIQDERVIPHFVKLGQLPRVEPRYAACDGLKKFKTDEAFAALKAIAAATADDLKDSAVNRQLEESSARAVRHSAVHALAECPHPDSLPLVWKAAGDESDAVRMTVLHKAFEVKSAEARAIIAKLTEDADERVRNEAKRYVGLLAKEKK